MFGGVAELVDNARDAVAEKVDVKFEKINGIHMLAVRDDGCGMDDRMVRRLLSIGRECATGSDWSTMFNHRTSVYQHRLCYTMPLYRTGALSRSVI